MKNPLVVGIDIGIEGVHAIIADSMGRVFADAWQPFQSAALPDLPPGYREQNADDWWQATRACLRQAMAQATTQGANPEKIIAGAISSANSSVVLLDKNDQPLRPALRCDDRRAQTEASEVNFALSELQSHPGYRFKASSALPKILWLARHEPRIWKKTRRIASPSEYIAGKITGLYGVSDPNSALELGFDLTNYQWLPFIETDFGITQQILPQIFYSGEEISTVSQYGAEETGLPITMRIAVGMPSDAASQIASGARHVGDCNTQLSTPIVFKGITDQLLNDPLNRIFCYLHPQGYWMPASESKLGIRVLSERFPMADTNEFNRAAYSHTPTSLLVDPLFMNGEKDAKIQTEVKDPGQEKAQSEPELYAAYLETIAFIERLSYGVFNSLGMDIRERIYTSGEGAKNREWMQIRADVLGIECALAVQANAAMGSAILAASRTIFESLEEASAQMIKLAYVISPRPPMVLQYADAYRNFLDSCQRRENLN